MWAMGCIVLELLVWLLWGHEEGLLIFHGGFSGPFWEAPISHNDSAPLPKIVHPTVTKTIQFMKKENLRCRENTALGGSPVSRGTSAAGRSNRRRCLSSRVGGGGRRAYGEFVAM
ncbi:uncharacterized protein PV07_02545 [Cladophialophora immunda]|uniref:Protein kinase domain-containing protein n=1 Tax=Cladophialophora immunda TaxID=569365 RepID=A0A0D2AZX5_9EURO|nr:uncharacterized protein PV07_02545 [Cladophialophora immunda]KIW30852.1 hypothetical protein PV07_02545 [Cladophialophora immunda]